MRDGRELHIESLHDFYREWAVKYFNVSPEDPALCRDVALVREIGLNPRASRLLAEMLDALVRGGDSYAQLAARLDEAHRWNKELKQRVEDLTAPQVVLAEQ